MKPLIALLLTVFSTSAVAEWTKVGGNDTYTNYAELSTIHKSGNAVRMWSLVDFKVAQTGKGDNVQHLSTLRQEEYDCREEMRRLLIFSEHSKNMGAGEVVWQSGNTHAEFQTVSPGSVGETLLKVACGK